MERLKSRGSMGFIDKYAKTSIIKGETMLKKVTSTLTQDRQIAGNSVHWANWMSALALNTCKFCRNNHGKIIKLRQGDRQEVNAHPNCQCIYIPMRTRVAGTATAKGLNGADICLLWFKKLPSYYVTKSQARKAKWSEGYDLSKFLPGKMIGGDPYRNKDAKLPIAPDRTWYEADINYTRGKRNSHRIVYSNDGLIFVSYDHYHTFYEIVS
jgi:hypothetical protein